MNPLRVRPSPVPRIRDRGAAVEGVIAAAVALVVVVIALVLLRLPDTVDRLVVRNDTPFELRILASPGSGGWTPVGVVGAASTVEVRDVIDHGRSWTFAFSYAGEDGGTVTVERTDLVSAGWELVVPAEVGERLSSAGLAPSA